MKTDSCSEDVQTRAMAGDPVAEVEVLSTDKPDLSKAIRAALEMEVARVDPTSRIPATALLVSLGVPEWYKAKARRDVGQNMRRMGYHRDGEYWYPGKPSKALAEKKRPTLRVTRNQLRRLSRVKVCAILELCEQDLARRDRMKEI